MTSYYEFSNRIYESNCYNKCLSKQTVKNPVGTVLVVHAIILGTIERH